MENSTQPQVPPGGLRGLHRHKSRTPICLMIDPSMYMHVHVFPLPCPSHPRHLLSAFFFFFFFFFFFSVFFSFFLFFFFFFFLFCGIIADTEKVMSSYRTSACQIINVKANIVVSTTTFKFQGVVGPTLLSRYLQVQVTPNFKVEVSL